MYYSSIKDYLNDRSTEELKMILKSFLSGESDYSKSIIIDVYKILEERKEEGI